ncbi:TetR/AcrR family transcriptional regulator [Spongiactinospora sp. TRM90649]|uniref:TetR/AcrR family transcriptional regulator n=1 Tax=Spongiactinospora sp. TRM90649 TaxID=3031114 RepID=UPI0023F9005C|nr:TetR/AcrR family transcriptional regulator [Spongiactinospora sp. TRM90649]MDF5755681.1 TetR/AcrR family transcriptional regulator [Spongiactinospora sp. TRM90649]
MSREQPVGGHRERLLAGAMLCLREKGYAGTTVRDLVAVSGTNMASIGYHFGGKEALLHEALADCFGQWVSRVEKALFDRDITDEGLAGALSRALSVLFEVFRESRPMLVSFIEAFPPAARSETLRAKLAATYAETRAAGVAMVRRAAAEAGVEPPFDPEVFVTVVIALQDGLILQWLIDPDNAPDAQQVIRTLSALSVALNPPPG